MATRHDRFGKRFLRRAFAGRGTFSPEEEVSSEAQRFDGYFIPDPDRPPPSDDLLYRLGAQPAAFELVSEAPSTDDLVDLVGKLLNARHVFMLAQPPKPLAHLWVLCAGHPRTAPSLVVIA